MALKALAAPGGSTHPPEPESYPAALADAALIDAKACAAAGGVSVSWWHAEVREGRAPAPAIQQVRLTRWRLSDVRRFWIERASAPSPAAARLVEQAKKASSEAKKRRAALAASAA